MRAKTIKKSQEAAVKVTVPAAALALLGSFDVEVFEELFIVAGVEFVEGTELGCEVVAAQGAEVPPLLELPRAGRQRKPSACVQALR